MLSSSDEEATLTEDEFDTPTGTNTPNGFRPSVLDIDTDTEDRDLETYLPTVDRADSSPTEQESPDYWGDINDELADFMGSDVEDDSDSESVRSEKSTTSTSQQQKLKTPPSARKRKRDAEAEPVESGEGGGEEDEEGSRLQKRKKEAMARTSSLTQMANVPSSNGSTPAKGEDPGGGVEEEGEGEGEGDDELEAMLAAEMAKEDDG